MEKILDTTIDAVRLDAIMKLKNVDNITKDQQKQVIDAAKNIMKLADVARKEGLLALEKMVEMLCSDYLRQLIILVVDGTFPDMITEIATNLYWTNAPVGANAMVDYIYLRGMLGIQNGENLTILNKLLVSLMPAELRQEFRSQMELLHQNEEVQNLFNIHPSFQNDSGIWESIHNLENIISHLPNRCIQRLLRELDHQSLAICIYVLHQEVRKKLLDNLSAGLAHSIIDEVPFCVSISEKDVASSILKVLDTIQFLMETGEIIVSDADGKIE